MAINEDSKRINTEAQKIADERWSDEHEAEVTIYHDGGKVFMSKTVEFVELSNGAKLLNMGFADQDFFMESASVETKSFQFGIDGSTDRDWETPCRHRDR